MNKVSELTDASKATLSHTIVAEIDCCRKAFRELTGELLVEVSDISELESLEQEISVRLACVNFKYASNFKTLFKSKVTAHLPVIACKLGEIESNIEGII